MRWKRIAQMLKYALALVIACALPMTAADASDVLGEFPADRAVVELPVRFVDGDIIVRIAIAGRNLDFVLDSGASNIVIDGDVARDLHLESEPAPAGEARVDVPEMTIGALTLRNVIASAMPLDYRAKDRTEIAGFLGYDFLAGAVIHVDYEHRRAFAIAPSAFDPSGLGVKALPIALEDGVPMVSAKVGDSSSERFIVDSGADDVYLFDTFARTHRNDVTDRRGAAVRFSSLPYLDETGAAARMSLVAVEVSDFVFADIDFHHFLAYRVAPDASGVDAETDADGLIGYRFLKYYDVYFDYPAARLFLVPNDLAPHR
jgi:hypothetical protein